MVAKIKNPFWKETWLAFSELCADPETAQEISNQSLWNNQMIKKQGKTLFIKNLEERGIQNIGDLLDENLSFLSFQDFKNKYNIEWNFIGYTGLINSISRGWRQSLSQREQRVQNTAFSLEKAMAAASSTKFFYQHLINMKKDIPIKTFQKWSDALQKRFNLEDWNAKNRLIYSSTNDTKLRSLQYKIIHRRYPTKDFLFKIKITDDDLCSFCNNEKETLEHVFYKCKTTRKFQNDLIETFDDILEEDSLEFFLMGSNQCGRAANFIALFQRNYIHLCRYKEGKPDVKNFIGQLKSRLKIEQLAATIGSYREIFEKVWTCHQSIRYLLG